MLYNQYIFIMNTTDQDQDKPMSPEEIQAYRTKMSEFHAGQIPLLELHKQNECLAADIEEARLRRFEATLKLAELMMHMKESQAKTDPAAKQPQE